MFILYFLFFVVIVIIKIINTYISFNDVSTGSQIGEKKYKHAKHIVYSKRIVSETCHLRWCNDTDVLKIEFHASSPLSSPRHSEIYIRKHRVCRRNCIAAWFSCLSHVRVNEEERLMIVIVRYAAYNDDITNGGSCPKRIESRNWRFARISVVAPAGRISFRSYKPCWIAGTWNEIMPIVPGHNWVAIGLRSTAMSKSTEIRTV